MNKTDIIKQMLKDEFPINYMIKAPIYLEQASPFRLFRDGVKNYANITHSEDGVSFYDPELDIDEIDEFIRNLPEPSVPPKRS